MTLAQRLRKSDHGAVAPIVALSLFALIGVGGVAFDYARLASMDSELQNAADQAALAAASQLDGKDGACARAALAASTLIANNTRFANDGSGLTINVANESTCDGIGDIRFYSEKDKSVVATTDSAAKFVEVDVGRTDDTNGRTAFYALTPVVGAFSSGPIIATAYAGVDSAVCGVVPFFVCNPDEPIGNDEDEYPTSVASGIGMLMLEGGQQKGPGNFGFLAYAGQGANNLEEALSSNVSYEQCTSVSSSTTAETEPGQKEAVFASLNRRFDLDTSCPVGPCSPSTNVRKDLVREAGNCTWIENPATSTDYASKRYRPLTNAALPASTTPQIMGHPRDICHSLSPSPACTNGQIGDGVWDRAAYFRSNHPGLDWEGNADLGADVTRYQTYLWEAEQEALTSGTTLATKSITGSSPALASHSTPETGKCLYPGLAPNSGGIDRRRVTAAVVNCRAYGRINGRRSIPVASYIDVFLVEPSLNRKQYDGTGAGVPAVTNRDDIYVEVIGASGAGTGGGAGQITRRDVPYLIE